MWFVSSQYQQIKMSNTSAFIVLSRSWWCHQMETFSTLLALCVGNSPVTGEFSSQRPVTRSFDVFFDRRLNKRLSKQSWGWRFEAPSRPLWRHCNVLHIFVGSVQAHTHIHWHTCLSSKDVYVFMWAYSQKQLNECGFEPSINRYFNISYCSLKYLLMKLIQHCV